MAQGQFDVGVVYRDYGHVVLRRVLRFYSGSEAEEVVQEVFLKALERQDSFRGASSPVTWLYRVATNHCLNRLRDERRRRELLRAHAHDVPGARPRSHDPDARIFLASLWSQLDEEHAAVGTYYYVDGLTHDRIAELVGCSPRTVGNRLAAIRRLAESQGGLP